MLKLSFFALASFALYSVGTVEAVPFVERADSPDPRYPLLGQPCTIGQFTCDKEVVYQCNVVDNTPIGAWVLNNDCNFLGLVCTFDYECAPKRDNTCPTSTVLEYKTKTVTETETATKTVTKKVVDCDYCTVVPKPHRPYSDATTTCTETPTETETETETETPLGNPSPTPTPTGGVCTVGDLQCLDSSVIQQCAWGIGEIPEWRTLAVCADQNLKCSADVLTCHF